MLRRTIVIEPTQDQIDPYSLAVGPGSSPPGVDREPTEHLLSNREQKGPTMLRFVKQILSSYIEVAGRHPVPLIWM